MRRPQEPAIRRPTTVSNRYVLHIGLDPTPWVDDDQGRPQPDTGGELCTSSASKPELVLGMITALDVHDGHTVTVPTVIRTGRPMTA